MSAGDSLRELLGYGKPQLTFLGRDFDIVPEGLIPLLRYAKANQYPEDGHDRTDAETEQAALAASHRLLQDCVIDFTGLETLAMEGKAGVEDVTGAVGYLISYYCARNRWPATRLIAYVAANLEQIDGQLIRAGGSGVASLTAREACNLALASLLDGRDEEDRTVFLQDLNYEGNADAEALAMVRQMQAARAAAAAEAEPEVSHQ